MVFYSLRITSETIKKEEIADFLGGQQEYWVIGEEYEKNRHFHVLFSKEQLNREEFRNELYDKFKPDTRGNSFYSLKEVEKFNEAGAYTIKDGDYIYSNPAINDVTSLFEPLSYEKPPSYEKALDRLYSKFQDPEENMTPYWLWVRIYELRSSYDLGVNLSKLDEMVLGQMGKRNREYIIVLANRRKIFSME